MQRGVRGRAGLAPPPRADGRPKRRSLSEVGRVESLVDAAEADRCFGWPSTLRDGDADGAMMSPPERAPVRPFARFA